MNVVKKLIPVDALKETIKRFPLSALCSVVLCALIILQIHEVIDLEDDMSARIGVLASCGFFLFGFVRLVAEGKVWRGAKEYMLALAGFVALGVIVFLNSGFMLAWVAALVTAALMLGISVAPFIGRGDDISFWFYNRKIWFGAAIAFLAALVWWGGLSAALGAIDYLFGVDVDEKTYFDIWAFSATVFGPLYALSWVPEKFEFTDADCHAPPQLAFLLNWVLAPLVSVYMLILYAYFIKIALMQELPRGQLSYMVTAFAGAGVVTYLGGWALREQGGVLLKGIQRFLFPALIIPVAMQAASIYLRLDQYGVTEQRYLVALSTLWFGGLALVYTFKKPPLKYITGSLGVLLFVAAIGPFSAPSLAVNSQMDRLQGLLTRYEILVDGAIQKTESAISFEDRQNISSILSFLRTRDEKDRLRPWLVDLKAEDSVPSAHKLTEQMGFKYTSRYSSAVDGNRFNFYGGHNDEQVTDVRPYSFILKRGHISTLGENAKPERVWDLDGLGQVKAVLDDSVLTFAFPDGRAVSFDLLSRVKDELKDGQQNNQNQIVMEQQGAGINIKLLFYSVNGRFKNDLPVVDSVNFETYIGGNL